MPLAIRSLCVLCGSRDGNDPAYREASIRFGMLMAERQIRLVYGGGSVGLMGIIADTVLAAGGTVIGIIPDFLMKYEVGHSRLTELVVTGSMQDRKRRMFEQADGFVVLPGGLGTLDEALEILTWKQLRLHSAPVVLLDVDGCWQPFRVLIDAVIRRGFAHPAVTDLFTIVGSPDAVFPALEAAVRPTDEVLTSHL